MSNGPFQKAAKPTWASNSLNFFAYRLYYPVKIFSYACCKRIVYKVTAVQVGTANGGTMGAKVPESISSGNTPLVVLRPHAQSSRPTPRRCCRSLATTSTIITTVRLTFVQVKILICWLESIILYSDILLSVFALLILENPQEKGFQISRIYFQYEKR